MPDTKTPRCPICRDGRGFLVRACSGCSRQKVLNRDAARIYGQPVGTFYRPVEPAPAREEVRR